MTQVDDSDRRCPRCYKKMMLQIGQESNEGWVEMQHDCWSCGYSEPDKVWRRPLPTRDVEGRPARSQAERLRQIRRGARPSQVWVWDSETKRWREAANASE